MQKIFIGIDVSKGYADISFIDASGYELSRQMKLSDSYVGHRKLLDNVDKIRRNKPRAVIYYGMESTGGYEKNWIALLKKYSKHLDRVYVLSGKSIKHFHISSPQRNKTDPISSHIIAHYLRERHEFIEPVSGHCYQHARKKLFYIHRMIKQNSEDIAYLKSLLYESFPEINQFIKQHVTQWVLLLLQRYPTTGSFLRAKARGLNTIPFITKENLQRLQDICKRSLIKSAKDFNDENSTIIKELANNIMAQKHRIDSFYRDLKSVVSEEDLKILCSIPGVGEKIALALVVLIGDYRRYSTGKKLSAFFGVHPEITMSGDKRYSRISKQGNPLARKILYQACLNMFKTSSPFNSYIEIQVSRMRVKKKVLGKAMHMLTRIALALLRKRELFDIEKFNQSHVERETKHSHGEYMDFENNFSECLDSVLDAPISYKKAKEIKKLRQRLRRQESQCDHMSQSTGSSCPTKTVASLGKT